MYLIPVIKLKNLRKKRLITHYCMRNIITHAFCHIYVENLLKGSIVFLFCTCHLLQFEHKPSERKQLDTIIL